MMVCMRCYTKFMLKLPNILPRGILYGDGGQPPGFSESYPLLITKTCSHTHFYDEFQWKAALFELILASFSQTHPFSRKSSYKWTPFFREFSVRSIFVRQCHFAGYCFQLCFSSSGYRPFSYSEILRPLWYLALVNREEYFISIKGVRTRMF